MITCGFFNSVNNDRTYNADDMAMPYKRLISNGVFAKPSGEQSDDFKVIADGTMTIKVNSGNGIFDYKWVENTSPLELSIPLADTFLDRIDSVIMRVNYETRICEILLIEGEPSETPVAPQIVRNNTFVDYRLANIKVEGNATGIQNIDITDTRASTDCGFITSLLQQPDITSIYSQWYEQFNAWFTNLKETLTTVTIISSFSSQYITTEENERTIPINIDRFNSVLDILQVYVNGLIAIKDVDYTIDDFDNIVLAADTVSVGTKISFIVYKSVDGSDAETVVREVDELFVRVRSAESRITALEKPTSVSLWSGADQMDETKIITPSKKLSDCKTGWCLVWSQYSNSAAGNADFVTSFIPRAILQVPGTTIDWIPMLFSVPNFFDTLGSAFTALKRLDVSSTQIKGFAGNTKTTEKSDSANVCLRAVYEY